MGFDGIVESWASLGYSIVVTFVYESKTLFVLGTQNVHGSIRYS